MVLILEKMMSKDIKALLAQKLAENNARHANANQSTHLDIGNELKCLPLDKIQPNRYQPRTVFDENELNTLADSIKESGLLQPISVREIEDGYYEIIAGERRYKAHQLLGKNYIDAIVTQANDSDIAVLALAENASRQDLCDYEIGRALRQIEYLFPNKSRLAEAIGLNREDMYRYFSYEAFPSVFLDQLAQNPKLLSRTAATQIKQVLNEYKPSEETINKLLSEVWKMLNNGEIEQTKIANYLRLHLKSIGAKEKVISNPLIKPVLKYGKEVGKIQHKGNKFVLELQSSVVSVEQEQALEAFINQLLS